MPLLRPDFNLVGGVAIAETYKRCQFIAIVGGGEKPRFAENTGAFLKTRPFEPGITDPTIRPVLDQYWFLDS